jgi:hypothetical protein
MKNLNTVPEIKEYLDGVIGRSNHHAPNVGKISNVLMSKVLHKNTGDISVRTYASKTANILWFHVNDRSYSMSFNHQTSKIDLSNRSTKVLVDSFDDSSSFHHIDAVFDTL